MLLKDILRVGSMDDSSYTHFVGSVVYKEESTFPEDLDKYLIIDGQQRITTATILILAICEYLRENNTTCGNNKDNAEKLCYTYVYNQLETGDNRYKLLLNEEDRESLNELVDNFANGKPNKVKNECNIFKNYNYFKESINKDNVDDLYKGFFKLIIITISLDNNDNPQLIFESLNCTGMARNKKELRR
ncbi:MAG: DUF262 domain-containing protein [Methanosphaera sp.]|nr:DUF262 domain-containing protein [Methanosphaera sp.]